MSQGPDSLFQPPQAQMSPSHGMLKRDVQFGFTYACAEINERPGQCGGWKRTKFGHVCAGQCGGPADFGPIARRAGLSLACNLWRGPATTGKAPDGCGRSSKGNRSGPAPEARSHQPLFLADVCAVDPVDGRKHDFPAPCSGPIPDHVGRNSRLKSLATRDDAELRFRDRGGPDLCGTSVR